MKNHLRKQITYSLNQLTDDQFEKSSSIIKETVLKEPVILTGDMIAITMSNKREVDTIQLIQSLWQLEKKVAVPKCNPKTRSMTFYLIENFEQLEIGYMNIQEPNEQCTVAISPENISCMIVPGVVFDQDGYRIGYGGGYYDRYLSKFNGNTISIAFEMQIVEKVPTEAYDLPVDFIITEQRRIDCAKNRRNRRNEIND